IAGGLSYSTDVFKQSFEASVETDIDSLRTGVSFRFADTLYVGLMVGKETVRHKEPVDPQSNWNGDRSVSGAGVAYVNNGPWRMHAEVSLEDHGDVGDVGKAGAAVIRSSKLQSVMLEGGHGLWVFGLNLTRSSQVTDLGSDNSTFTSNGREFTVGVMPEKGIALLFHYGSADGAVKDPSTTTKIITVSRALSAIWTF
ncbi:MAG TPA: hypothetical protein VF678_09625, partial [bacterium]